MPEKDYYEETFKTKKCLKCGYTTDPEDDEELYCSACGAPLINRCSDYTCGITLQPTAAYCKKCGAESIFLNWGLVSSKNSDAPVIFDEKDLPF